MPAKQEIFVSLVMSYSVISNVIQQNDGTLPPHGVLI